MQYRVMPGRILEVTNRLVEHSLDEVRNRPLPVLGNIHNEREPGHYQHQEQMQFRIMPGRILEVTGPPGGAQPR